MVNSLIGTKIGMTHSYSEAGEWIPVTRLMLGPCTVTQVKQEETDGYRAVQLAFGSQKELTKPMGGHLEKAKSEDQKAKTSRPRFIREIRGGDGVEVGDQIKVADVFEAGGLVKVTGTTKGRGFAGVVKRWGFAGGSRTRGQSDRQRAPGSIGQGTDPGRVHKGKKMPGHLGVATRTVMGLRVVKVDEENNELWVAGAVPGPRDGLVKVSVLRAAGRADKETKR